MRAPGTVTVCRSGSLTALACSAPCGAPGCCTPRCLPSGAGASRGGAAVFLRGGEEEDHVLDQLGLLLPVPDDLTISLATDLAVSPWKHWMWVVEGVADALTEVAGARNRRWRERIGRP